MIIIGIVLLGVGLLVSLLAFRGRVVARGVFCKKCRFDLAGLDIEAGGAKCPECGSEVFLESARRGLLHQRSRVGLAAAALLMLAGGGGIWVGAAGKTGSMIAAMPDSVVLWLTDLGVDEALDELVVRVPKVPGTMSAKSWDDAIEQGLAFQADTALVWDVRWGEVLFQGLNQGKMSDDQLERYFVNAHEIELTVRDRVHPGADGFGYMLEWDLGRSKMLTGGTTAYLLFDYVTAYGVKGEEPVWTSEPNIRARIGLWLDPYGSGQSSMQTATWRMNEYFTQEPGSSVDVYLDYSIKLVPVGDTEPIFTHTVRKEFVIQIVDESEPIVRTSNDEEAVRRVMDNMQIAPIRIMGEIEEPKPNYYTQVMRIMLDSSVPFGPLSLEVFLLIDGQEIMVGSITHNSIHASYRGHMSYGIKPGDTEGMEAAKGVHARLLKDQLATVIIRTNAALVENIPGIEEVLGVEFMFEDVPVEIVETSSELNTPARDGAQGKAVPIVD